MPPLAHARTLPAAALFRETVDRRRGIDRVSMIAVACAATAAVSLALVTAREPLFAASVLGAVGAVLLLLLGIGRLVRRMARRVTPPRAPLARLAVANLHRDRKSGVWGKRGSGGVDHGGRGIINKK